MIKFESEKAFEDMLFQHIKEIYIDPIQQDPVFGGLRQPSLGELGIGDILLINEYPPMLTTMKGKRYLHLIELKTTPITSMHVAQVCRYQEFFNSIENLKDFGVNDVRYSLVNSQSIPDKNVIYLAKSCGVRLYQYTMTMSGISFSEYEDQDADPDLCVKALEKLLKDMGVENVS